MHFDPFDACLNVTLPTQILMIMVLGVFDP